MKSLSRAANTENTTVSRKWSTNGQCRKYGKVWHGMDGNCLASESTCDTCNKVGLWSRVCKNRKTVSKVTEQSEQLVSCFLGVMSKADGSSEQWTVELLVGSFKINRGDVNIIGEETYHTLIPKRL